MLLFQLIFSLVEENICFQNKLKKYFLFFIIYVNLTKLTNKIRDLYLFIYNDTFYICMRLNIKGDPITYETIDSINNKFC